MLWHAIAQLDDMDYTRAVILAGQHLRQDCGDRREIRPELQQSARHYLRATSVSRGQSSIVSIRVLSGAAFWYDVIVPTGKWREQPGSDKVRVRYPTSHPMGIDAGLSAGARALL
jgi:hypothetical protein